MQLVGLGDSGILINAGVPPDQAAPLVRQWMSTLARDLLPGVVDLMASYTTVAVFYDPPRIARGQSGATPQETVRQWIQTCLQTPADEVPLSTREFVVPVCYGGGFGMDLEEVSRATKLSAETVVQLHTGAVYEVRAVGFSPGFPYLAGLPAELQVARRATPRIRVAAGSVAIGGSQTGIYSLTTPGGWNVIGWTPWILFDAQRQPPSLFQTGDRLRFVAIEEAALPKAGKGPLQPVAAASPRLPTS